MSDIQMEILVHPSSPITDVEMEPFLWGLWINVLIFFVLIASYELCSRLLPSVYAPSQKFSSLGYTTSSSSSSSSSSTTALLFTQCLPFAWVPVVARVPWSQVLSVSGLDAYMFLRYIRMCGVITAVSGFWGAVVLFPTYAAAGEGETGWYHLSMANVYPGSWRLWISVVFLWFTTFFVFYLMSEEYKHYLELRMNFLAAGGNRHIGSGSGSVSSSGSSGSSGGVLGDVSAQDQYTLMVDCIPHHLRSDKALFRYFDGLYPGKIHSAKVVLNIPDLEALCVRRERVVRRLEKSMAYFESTGRRAKHVVGRTRIRCCGVESLPFNTMSGRRDYIEDYEKRLPQRGEKVDSINYYTNDLSVMNEKIATLQAEKLQVAAAGNEQISATERLASTLEQFGQDSLLLVNSNNSSSSSPYGMNNHHHHNHHHHSSLSYCAYAVRNIMGFVFGGLSLLDRTLDVVVDRVEQNVMSSCGFLTFGDLATTTCAASTRVSTAPTLLLTPAPEPRDLVWEHAHIDYSLLRGRGFTANAILILGVVFWSVPVASIQSLPNLEKLSEVLGVEWILNFRGGVVRGYLPVLALLGLIQLLPPIFEAVAVKYENRKTQSDIQNSILGRFFYYQLANIFITVTAASVWDSLSEVVDRPSEILKVLGRTIPNVVGYFIALLITKILAGLPVVLLRPGALGRMLFIKLCYREKMMSQRELNEVYKRQCLYYGYEYPTQLLVITICFTYTSISPIILPVGAIYFLFAFFVYKKQCLIVYSPTYEAGGIMFSSVCHRTLIGLVCGQVTLIGYMLVRGGVYQTMFLLPLPFITIYMMYLFDTVYAVPSRLLTLERAKHLDFTSVEGDTLAEPRLMNFSKDTYRQPSLTVGMFKPFPYRTDRNTDVDGDVDGDLAFATLSSLSNRNNNRTTTTTTLGTASLSSLEGSKLV